MPSNLRIGVYGHVNLNLIDGSSIWLTSLLRTLSIAEDVRITTLLSSLPVRSLLITPLEKLRNVQLIPPPVPGLDSQRKIAPEAAIDALVQLDRDINFDIIILRGFSVCLQAAQRTRLHGKLWCYLTDIPQNDEEMDSCTKVDLGTIADSSEFILCQTEQLRAFIENHIPQSHRKTALLPPMIPDFHHKDTTPDKIKRLVYAGKFAPLWAFDELLECYLKLRHSHDDVELHVFGDKIHNPPEDPSYMPRVENALKHTDGLVWHRGTSREQVIEALSKMDLAWGWRRKGLDDNLELSTKILEYGICGVPVVVSRNSMHEQLLGPSYPLMAASTEEVFQVCNMLWTDPDCITEAAANVTSISKKHTFENIYRDRLRTLLNRNRRYEMVRGKTILIAGHDLRFIQNISRLFANRGYKITIDRWKGHEKHDEEKSQRLLNQADIIIAEWCLGNAVWYSKNVRSHQRLLVRLHLQERDTGFPYKVNMDNVHKVIFVGPHILREVQRMCSWPVEKLEVLPNYVDEVDFNRDKLEDSTFNLGMSGICPSRKRMDLALDMLEHLRSVDSRFKLYIKGKMPWEYEWLWKKPEERSYYEQVFSRIDSSSLLENAVVFDSYGEDIASWYRKIGFIISTSDFESFHLAVAEGAISGAIPVVFNWEGADQIYPSSWVHSSVVEAVEFIQGVFTNGNFSHISTERKAFALENFALEVIFEKWCKLLEDD